jgi:hypothetical protein
MYMDTQKLSDQSEPTFLSDLWHFLKSNKKWWLLPIVIVILLIGLLALLSGSAAAPFIYTLF